MADYFSEQKPRVAILGVRGVPAAHGGFETFAARLAPHLARSGWSVTVYCQESDPEDAAQPLWESTWEGVNRIHIAVPKDTAINSMLFDWRCLKHVVKQRPQVVLMLGYNTAVFAIRLVLRSVPLVINMDGLEWKRAKWGPLERAWLYANERAACLLGDHLIADHPQIERHLRTRNAAKKITVIPYGAEVSDRSGAQAEPDVVLQRLGLAAQRFATLIARPEPENSILEIVRAFSAKPRNIRLVVLGTYYPQVVKYHADVLAAAGSEVVFPGPIYDAAAVLALRRHCLFYLHGHRVGGTNPSLLEAMGAGNAVLAHDNHFNRWVVRDGARYFADQPGCERAIDAYLADAREVEHRGTLNRSRAARIFSWSEVLQSYSELLGSVSLQANTRDSSSWGRRAQWDLDAAQ